MIDMYVCVVCVKDKIISDGEYILYFCYDFDFYSELNLNWIFLRWFIVFQYKIILISFFWVLDEGEIKFVDFELIVFFQGVIESMGMLFQVCIFYLFYEIFWQYKFKFMFIVCIFFGVFEFDYKQFNEIIYFLFLILSVFKKFVRVCYMCFFFLGDYFLGGELGIVDMDDVILINLDSIDLFNDSIKYQKVFINMYD